MANKFTPKAQHALNAALGFASELGHSYIGSEHLLLGLLSTADCAAAKILSARGIRSEIVKGTIIEVTGIGSPEQISPSNMTPSVKKIIEVSAYESTKSNHSYIGTEHILLALLSDGDCVAVRMLESLGASVSELRGDVESYLESSPGRMPSTRRSESNEKTREKNSVKNYGRNLTEAAKKGQDRPDNRA